MTPQLAHWLSRVALVANQKGGVGKSSICASGGQMLARPKRRVLLIDGDQQGNLTRNDLGAAGDRGKSLAMALQYGQPLEPVRDVRPGLDLIPGGPLLSGMAGVLYSASQTGVDLTENLAVTLGALCEAEQYALVLIDSGPGDTPLLDVYLNIARYLLVPSGEDEASIDGVELLAGRYLRAKSAGALIDLLGVILFGVNPRATTRNRATFERIAELLEGSGSSAFQTTIRSDKASAIDMRNQHLSAGELVAAAERQKQSRLRALAGGRKAKRDDELWSRDPSGLALDYQNLGKEIVARVAEYEGRHRTEGA
jgi:cellulose biosynthesis protein BcsQ